MRDERQSMETLSFWCWRLKRGAAFTLAEVLITLGIIGVVAALTMPTLIQSYQKKVTATKLQKVYSTLAQALENSKVEHGDISQWGFEDFVGHQTSRPVVNAIIEDFISKHILPYVAKVKNAEILSLSQLGYEGYIKTWYGLDIENAAGVTVWPLYTIILSDGTIMRFEVDNYAGRLSNIVIGVDLNGVKGPNVCGKDWHIFRIDTSVGAQEPFGFYRSPKFGRSYIYNSCMNKKNGGARYCSTLIMIDGWKISDDYPW